MIIYHEFWKCKNRTTDSGNALPKYPALCGGCPDYTEAWLDQGSDPILRCLQSLDGSPKAPKFRHIWERLG